MMNPTDARRDGARRRAEDKLAKDTKREAAIVAYQRQMWDLEAAKIARLRALREARDAAEGEVKHCMALKKIASARPKRADKADGGSERPSRHRG